ncbi:hypothetical protein ACIRH0_11675 [Streptomyces sp. NPDC093675]|uniref:hypothetical protein n=1 Tax=Streptomyces sp. NPDC093675 TaxID=3366049 RepID=UPI0037F300E2
MGRGTAVRFTPAILSAVLLALYLLAPSASPASAHKPRATAAATPEAVMSKRADEAVTRGGLGHSPGPTGPLRTRDRHRASADAVPKPPAPTRQAGDITDGRPPTAHRTAPGISRPSTAHSPAALQVFRR